MGGETMLERIWREIERIKRTLDKLTVSEPRPVVVISATEPAVKFPGLIWLDTA